MGRVFLMTAERRLVLNIGGKLMRVNKRMDERKLEREGGGERYWVL